MKKTNWLFLEEASEFSRIPVRTLTNFIHQGKLKAYKPGKRVLIDAEELERFIRRYSAGPEVA